MKKIILLALILIINNQIVFAQIQHYYVVSQRTKGYDFSLKAWNNWGEWGIKHYQDLDNEGYNEKDDDFTVDVSDTAIRLSESYFWGREGKGKFSEYTLTFKSKPDAGNGYLLYVPVYITQSESYVGGNDGDREYPSKEYEGYLYSSNISWTEIKSGTKKEAIITLWSVQRGFIHDYKIELKSYFDYKIQKENEAEEKKERTKRSINNAAYVLEKLLRNK